MTSTGDYLTWQSLPLTGPHRSAEGSQSVRSARQFRHRRSLRFLARPGHWPAFALCRTNKTLITVFCKRFEEELCGLLAGGFDFQSISWRSARVWKLCWQRTLQPAKCVTNELHFNFLFLPYSKTVYMLG